MPPFVRYLFAEGNILYKDEKIWTRDQWMNDVS